MIVSPWTPERVQLLRELYAKNLSCSQIAADMGNVTRNGVIGKLHRLGLTNAARPNPKATTPRQPRERTIRGKRAVAPAIRPVFEPAPEPITVGEVIPLHHRVSLLDAATGQCRWPAADDGTASMVCGAKNRDGVSWCPRHCGMGYLGKGA